MKPRDCVDLGNLSDVRPAGNGLVFTFGGVSFYVTRIQALNLAAWLICISRGRREALRLMQKIEGP